MVRRRTSRLLDASERLAPSEAVRRLLLLQEETTFPRDPLRILDLAALPTFELRRPRSWDALDETARRIAELTVAPRADTTSR